MIKSELKSRAIYLLAVISVAMIFLAYQVRTPLEIDLGEQGDEAYLRNFYDMETADDLSYRWSSDRSSIILPGIGGYAPALLRVRLNGSRPPGLPQPTVSLGVNGSQLSSFIATDQFVTYDFAIPKETVGMSGNLEVEIDSEFFVPAEVMEGDDLRKLGVLVDKVSLEFEQNLIPIVIPPPRQLSYLVFAGVASLLFARQLGLPRAISFTIGGLLVLAFTVLVIQQRLLVGRYSVWLLGLLAIANGSLVLARLAKGWATTKRRFRDADVADLQLILAVIVVLALSQYLLLALLSQVREDAATDFFINYTAAMVLAQGRNIYDVSSLREASQLAEAPSPFFDFSSLFVTYITPPFHVILLVPFVPLGYEKARIAYLLLNNILLFSSLAMVLRARSAASRSSVPQCLLALLLVFTFEPIYVSLKLGQVDFVILFLIATSFWAYKSGRDAIVGVCLALAAMIKLSPALLIVYFLWKREFSVFVSAVVTTVLVGMLSWAIVGHEAVLFFSTTLLPALLKGSAFFQNQSLNGLISRFFVDPRLYYSLEEFPSIRQARVLSGLASLALVGVGAFITRKRIDRNSLRFDLEFSLAMVTMLLVSSISWEHYFTWLLIPFLILLDPELKSRLTTPRYMPLIITALLAYLTIIIPSRFYGVSLHSSDASFPVKTALTLLLSLRVYGALLLYSIFAYLIPKSQSRGSDSSIR